MHHKKKITFLGALFVVFIAIISLLGGMQNNVEAGTANPNWPITDRDIINAAPYGLSLDNYFMFSPKFETGDVNSARSYVPASNKNEDAVILTDGKGETSSVWSDIDGDNYIDTNKKQTLSMWLYFGRNVTTAGAADGMAFVLQNAGTNPISNSNGHVNNGETLGVWGADSQYVTNGESSLETSKVLPIQQQAIQKSWALEFDTFLNNGSSKVDTNYDNNSGGKVVHNLQNDYSSNASLPDTGDAFDWLFYDDKGNTSRGPHISFGYPAEKDSYVQLSNDPPYYRAGILGFPGSLGGKSIMALKHSDLSNSNDIDFTYNQNKPKKEAWKHITITYTPPTAADPDTATIHYEFGDKDVYGKLISKPSGGTNTKASGTAKVDMKVFKGIDDNKLRYGFTGSTGVNTETTNAVVFETMPSLVEADTNSYAVDKDTNARVGSDTSLMDTEAQSMSETKKVHPDDNIGLNYILRYDSGKQPSKDIVATVDVPDNLTIKNDDGNIGSIYYSSADSSETSKVAINADSLATDGKSVSVNINDLGIADSSGVNWKTARIELNTTANKPDSGQTLTVPAGHAVFEGSNYKSDTEIPTFTIAEPADTLFLAKVSGDGKYDKDSPINLKGKIYFVKNNTQLVDRTKVWYTYTIDSQSPVRTQDTLSDDDEFSIPITGLTENTPHKITVKASMTLDSGEIITSNVITYEVTVVGRRLEVTPDKSEITVDDSLPVKLSGTYKHNDGSELEGDKITIKYLIHSENTTKEQDSKTITYNTGYQNGDTSREFSFDVVPVGYNRNTTLLYDAWHDAIMNGTSSGGMPFGLRVGKNTVDVLITDEGGHSVRTVYTINVPDVNLNVSLDNDDLKAVSGLGGSKLNVPLIVSYDGSYKVNSLSNPDKGMLLYTNKPDPSKYEYARTSLEAISDSADDTPVTTADTTASVDQYNLKDVAGFVDDSKETGIGSKQPAEFFIEDLYGRKSNTVKGTITWVSKSATLTSNTDYKFNAVNKSAESRIIKRNGKWTLGVDSVQSAWNLTASAEPMTTKDVAGNILTLPGNLIFVDKDNNSFSMDSDTPIASDPDVDSEDVDIAGKWSDNDGILLNLTGEPEAGTYSTKISWTLSNTL